MSYADEYYGHSILWAGAQRSERQLDRARRTAELLPAEVESVLDIGCGTGVVTSLLAGRAESLFGLDLVPAVLRYIAVPTVCARAEQVPFADHSVDAILVTEVLEHLPRSARLGAVAEIKRVARKHVLVSVPFREPLRMRQLKCGECGCVFHADRHAASFDEGVMTTLFKPEFTCQTLRLIGPAETTLPDLVMGIAQAFGVFMRADGRASVCPQCGTREGFVSGTELARKLLLGAPLRLLARRRRARWVLALYTRDL